MQRSAKTHAAAAGEDRVGLRALVDYVRAAKQALIESGEEDAAHYFEMFEEYLINDYKPSEGLKFKSIQLGL